MKVRDMPYGEINYWMNRIEELKTTGFTKKAWCEIGHELMEKHGLTEKVAVRILHGRIDEAMALEAEQDAGGRSREMTHDEIQSAIKALPPLDVLIEAKGLIIREKAGMCQDVYDLVWQCRDAASNAPRGHEEEQIARYYEGEGALKALALLIGEDIKTLRAECYETRYKKQT